MAISIRYVTDKIKSGVKRHYAYYVAYSRLVLWPYIVYSRKKQIEILVYNITRYIQTGHFLDVGTGPAIFPIEMVKNSLNVKVTGIDIVQILLDDGQKQIDKYGFGNRISLIKANVESLPFPDNTFDLVVSTMSFHQWKDKQKGLTEIKRVLKPGMQVIILVGKSYLVSIFDDLIDYFTNKTQKIMRNHLEKVGFTNISFVDEINGIVYVVAFK